MKLMTILSHTCRNCRWWEPHGHPSNNEGFCRLRGHIDGHSIEYWKVQPRDLDGTYAPACWAKHDEVRTHPDFGCNQWEGTRPKDPTSTF